MKLLSIVIVVLFTTAPFILLGQDLSADYLASIEHADSLIKECQWDDAEKTLIDAMRANPASPLNVLLMSNVGMLRHYAGRDSAALSILDDAVAMAPKSVTVRNNRATIRVSLNCIDDALADYSESLMLDSMQLDVRRMRCILLMKLGRHNAVTADINFLDRYYSTTPETHEVKALFAIENEDYVDAVSHLGELIKERPLSTYYSMRARCCMKLERLNEASEDIAQALKLDPANGELYLYRALLNKRRFRPDDADADVKLAKKYGADSALISHLGL